MRPWIVRLPLGLLLLTAGLLMAAVLATHHGLQSWSQADLPFDLLIDGEDVGASLQQQLALSSLGSAAVLCLVALLAVAVGVGLLVAVPLLLLGLLGLVLLGLAGVLLAVLGGPLLALGLLLGLLLAPLVGVVLLLRWLVR